MTIMSKIMLLKRKPMIRCFVPMYTTIATTSTSTTTTTCVSCWLSSSTFGRRDHSYSGYIRRVGGSYHYQHRNLGSNNSATTIVPAATSGGDSSSGIMDDGENASSFDDTEDMVLFDNDINVSMEHGVGDVELEDHLLLSSSSSIMDDLQQHQQFQDPFVVSSSGIIDDEIYDNMADDKESDQQQHVQQQQVQPNRTQQNQRPLATRHRKFQQPTPEQQQPKPQQQKQPNPQQQQQKQSNPQQQQQQQPLHSLEYTPEQIRAYRLERERIVPLTEYILSLQDPEQSRSMLRQEAFCRQVREAFHYWISRRAAYMDVYYGNDPSNLLDRGSSIGLSELALLQGYKSCSIKAEQLLQWVLQQQKQQHHPSLLAFVIKTPRSDVGGLVHMIHNALLAFRGTAVGIQQTKEIRIRRETNWQYMHESIQTATRICQLTQSLVAMGTTGNDNDNNNIQHHETTLLQPDIGACSAFLSLWSRQCWLLSPLGGQQNYTHNIMKYIPRGARLKQISDCIHNMETLIHNMETLSSPQPIAQQRSGGAAAASTVRYPPPEPVTYIMLISALVYSGLPNSLQRAQEVLARIGPTMANLNLYNALIWGYAMHANKDPRYFCQQARDLLHHMQHDLSTRYPDLQPDIVSHSSMLLAYSNAGLPEEADAYLNEIEHQGQSAAADKAVVANTICYNTTMAAWIKSNRPEGLDRVLALLHRMQQLQAAGVPNVMPDRITYGLVIEAYAKSASPDGPDQAEALLFQTAADERVIVRPDIITYNKVLSALAKRGDDDGVAIAERVEQIVRRMQRQHEWSPNYYPAPDSASYNCCISAWTRSSSPQALNRAYALLNELEKAYVETKDPTYKPTRVTFNSILATVARSNKPDAIQRAEALLARMEQHGVTRDIWTYNTFLDVLARQNIHGTGGQNAERAMLILKTMESAYRGGNEGLRPNSFTYNTILKAVAKDARHDAPIRCERLLHRMIDLSQQPGRQDLRPNVMTFTTVLDAWSRSGRPDVLPRMEKLLDMMEGFATPNVVSFNTILNAISRSGLPDAGLRAEAVFRKLQALTSATGGSGNNSNDVTTANGFTFSTIITCWARSKLPGAAERADEYLSKMEALYRAGNNEFRPTARTYTSILDAWAKSPSPHALERSLQLFDDIEKQWNTKTALFRPNCFTYNAVLNSVAKKEEKHRKVQRAKEILARQIQACQNGNEEAAPNTVTYTIVLNACAFSSGTDEENLAAFAFAQETMKELRKRNLQPNAVTYGNYLLCCRYLLASNPDLQEDMAKAVFKEACDSGKLTNRLLEIFRATVSGQVYAESMASIVHFLDSSFADVPNK